MALTGKFFHTFNQDASFQWQGQIVDEVAPGIFMVQLYEWLIGSEDSMRLVPVSAMMQWEFYETSEQMQFHYKYQKQGRQLQEEHDDELAARSFSA